MTALGIVKRAVNHVLERCEHTVAHSGTVPSFNRLVGLLDHHGLMPQTVIDIGVADGTPWLYDAYPDAKWLLIDPTRESVPHMQRWAERLQAGVLNLALGDSEGTITIRVRDEIGASSLFDEIGPHRLVTSYEVPVRRFDAVVGAIERPCLCKIDVQGAELMVLRGMGERIHDIDVIVVETSLLRTLEGDAPELGDVVNAMGERGWVLYDIVGVTRRPLDHALAQIDAVFVPDASPLRSDRRWASVA